MTKPLSVDLLGTASEDAARRKTAIIAVFFALLVGILATVGAAASYRASSRGTSVLTEVVNLPGIAEITRFAWGAPLGTAAVKADEEQTNFLLLGVGGEGHDGPQLTDTMILATLDRKNNRLAMLSIPRDLAYPLGNGQFEKINSLNAYMEKNYPGEGAKRTADAVAELLNTHIDHVIRIDFDGFAQFIDALGGINVVVERSFTDTSYPAGESSGWMTVSFKAGTTTMDGTQALEFVRSRHGNNGEGSDFARSRRQQLVIEGVKEKILTLGTLANPKKISDLVNILSGHIQTDLSSWDAIALAPSITQIDRGHITMRVLSDAADGEVVAANVSGAYMLFPRKPDWSEIRYIANNPFVTKEDEERQLMPQTKVTLEIKNGTTYEGYAFQVSQKLKKLGYQVSSISNAAHRGYDRTVVFDLTNGQETTEVVRLKKILAADISTEQPTVNGNGTRTVYGPYMAAETVNATSSQIMIVLGESSLGLINPSYESPSSP